MESIRFWVDGPFQVSMGSRDPHDSIDLLPKAALSPPVNTRITPCGQPLVGKDAEGNEVPGFYFLKESLEVDRAFVFAGWVWGYRDPLPLPGDVLPITIYRQFFAQALGNGDFLCGPYMSYRRGTEVRRYPWLLDAPGDEIADIKLPFPIKRLPDGTRLIRFGPISGRGPTWRKDINYFTTKVFALTSSLEVRGVLSLSGRDYDGGYEVEFSDDWATVKEYRSIRGEGWSSKTFCLAGAAYDVCAEDPQSPAPTRPLPLPKPAVMPGR
jgi:hypothetical protein